MTNTERQIYDNAFTARQEAKEKVLDLKIIDFILDDETIEGFIFESEDLIIEIESGYAILAGGEENPYEQNATYFRVNGYSDYKGETAHFEKEFNKPIKFI